MAQKLKTLLRKLSIIDWIFLCLGISLLLGVSIFFRREVKFITVKLKVTDENVLYIKNSPTNEYAFSFTKGDVEKDELGRVISEITGIESYRISPSQQVVYLDIKLKTVYNPRKNQYTLQGKNIIFGESLSFSFNKVRFKALVVDFPGFQDIKNTRGTTTIVKAQLRNESRSYSDVYGVPDFIAESVKKGDVATDSKGNILVRILDVTMTPAKRLVVSNLGQPFLINDPYLKDVFYAIELSTKEVDGKKYIYDYLPILVGGVLPINIKTVSIWPTITEIIQ